MWFVYDGDCPICSIAAHALRIRQAVGSLYLLNARDNASHPLLQEIQLKGLDLDEGMVIKYHNSYYHGADALHIMAMLGTNQGWFNRMNALLFKSTTVSKLLYPSMRSTRNLLLKIKGVKQIRNLDK